MHLPKSSVGKISLIVAILGFLLLEIFMYAGVLSGPLWRILASGFEAATIGAIADWFAVSALFYEIPIPIVRRHTNIIVKNRQKLTEGIVDMVTNKWLSPDSIREKLEGVNLGKSLVEELNSEETLLRLLDVLRRIILSLTDQLDSPKLALWLQRVLKNQADKLDIEQPLGQWLADVIKSGKHHQLVAIMLEEVAKSIRKPETREVVYKKLRKALDEYSRQDWVKGTTVWIGKRTGGIDVDLLADRLVDIALVLAEEMQKDRNHPLRGKLDDAVLEFADSLQKNEAPSREFIQNLKRNLILHKGMQSVIRQALKGVQDGIQLHLSSTETALMRFLFEKIQQYIQSLLEDRQSMEALDGWLKGTLSNLLNTYHPEIGNIVRESLEKLDNQGLMEQIRDKVGNDLQYIRLNGAVVGGLVGLIIALVRWAWMA
ncbi:MAG: DUF445 domain-containing protein [Lunatimonas sp.]|uniref:DUF445 domain-containing protein n=1 Tax=Lunatimonas sp. TaxID=2060141 RepID=UPI00263A8A69|nr:DUF445 domain-containing protein [Lunatimonas sp.]MCC5939587.1 DUF445 domain-containing protein [Lunatimonas sp.]